MLWNENYVFNIPVIDEQHKKLIDLIEDAENLLSDAQEGMDCIDEVVGILEELEDYTVSHFDEEEKLMLAADYEGYDEHHMEHTFFIKKVDKALAADLDSDPVNQLIGICSFLKNWVTHHILDIDVQYVPSLKTAE